MIQHVTKFDFHDAFNAIRPDNFTYKALNALFDYFEELEYGQEKQIVFDVVQICCEYTQYEDLKEFQDNFDDSFENMDAINEFTALILIEDSSSFIIQDF
jgi:hypothetical protein